VLAVGLSVGSFALTGSTSWAAGSVSQHGLSAVSCADAFDCFAVGTTALSPRSTPIETLIERWHHRTWTVIPSPNPTGARNSQLAAVSCASVTSCFAVGQSAAVYNKMMPLIEQWDGTHWSIATLPSMPGVSASALYGVSCTSRTYCLAVGWQYQPAITLNSALTLRWDGTSWSVMPNLHAEGPNRLTGVSCVRTDQCFAGGFDTDTNGSEHPIVARWQGSNWTVMYTALVTDEQFTNVSCVKTTDCTAVGGVQFPIIVHWNGKTWTTPLAAGGGLTAVSCSQTWSCTLVGYPGTARNQPTIEHWNGHKMQPQTPAALAAGISAWLTGISCVSPSSCVAVGNSNTATFASAGPVIERWNGTRWAINKSPA